MPTCVTDLSSAKPATGLITPGLYDGLSCNFGNFAKGASASVRVFLQAGSTLAHDPTWRCFDALTGTTLNPCPGLVISGKVAEAVGGNVGGNNNTFYAYGDERSPYFVSGAGLVAGLFSKQASSTPSSHAAGTALTTIDITPLTGDYVVTVDEVSAGTDVSDLDHHVLHDRVDGTRQLRGAGEPVLRVDRAVPRQLHPSS